MGLLTICNFRNKGIFGPLVLDKFKGNILETVRRFINFEGIKPKCSSAYLCRIYLVSLSWVSKSTTVERLNWQGVQKVVAGAQCISGSRPL